MEVFNMNNAKTIIIHHSNVDKPLSQFPAIERYHKSLGFPLSSMGFFTGYHRLIDKEGRIITARADKDTGAHSIGWNNKSIGICLMGDFNRFVPTKPQLNSLREIIKGYNLPYLFHHEAQVNRTCAGFYFTRDLIDKKPQTEPLVEVDKKRAIQRQIWSIQAILNRIRVMITKL